MDGNTDGHEAIWQIGVFDAHCHPTDIMASVQEITKMKARVLTVMATRSQDQVLVEDAARMYPGNTREDVSEGASRYVIPAFGWHPWFSHQMYNDVDGGAKATPSAAEHYKAVLVPAPDDAAFLESLPTPRSLRQFLEQTEARLTAFPFALVGEVGLDRSFRLPQGPSVVTEVMSCRCKTGGSEEEYTPGTREGRPLTPYRVTMEHQKAVLRAQLGLAAKLGRPVSVHSVQGHGVVFEVIQNMWKGHEKPSKRERKHKSHAHAHVADDGESGKVNDALPFPPRICMHSYSGPPDALKQFLGASVPADIYFSFSSAINFSNASTTKVTSVIKAVPDDRILVESDLHCAGETMDNLLEEIVLKVCEIKAWSLEEGARRLKDNYLKFLFG
ncbi:hypothetical protein A1O3_02175 [Capronia epimyces CBS 606.96]|uniref:Cut9 interacting protein Scn1 n=1 Tax=Capronia epimyces CBS 606.96 TaxID=1182542 RepID=W9YIM6_9EURO|nr:uncharacterized protein A1O3_02175 [Capronia epimyces CBS 606.96]EXJ89111.1 hypothetical protein A1O3_02175 [Capronia epimyces CBS 606.96]